MYVNKYITTEKLITCDDNLFRIFKKYRLQLIKNDNNYIYSSVNCFYAYKQKRNNNQLVFQLNPV